ncbi:DUF1801 domain-containing protein [Niabella aquatica]
MMKELDRFYEKQPEPLKSCLLALRQIILELDKDITAEWKYALPFFYYKGKMLCYTWYHKKFKQPYLSLAEGRLIEHPLLIAEKRARFKIMLFDPGKDLPVKAIQSVLKQALDLHKSGKRLMK